MSNTNQTYKTTINCGGCVRAVTPFLNEAVGEGNWSVDTENPDKILSITRAEADVKNVIAAVEKAGFKIEHQP